MSSTVTVSAGKRMFSLRFKNQRQAHTLWTLEIARWSLLKNDSSLQIDGVGAHVLRSWTTRDVPCQLLQMLENEDAHENYRLKNLECVFGPYKMSCGGRPRNKSVVSPSKQTWYEFNYFIGIKCMVALGGTRALNLAWVHERVSASPSVPPSLNAQKNDYR